MADDHLAGRAIIARRALRIEPGEPATYALRIAGMMLFAFGLTLGGFVAVFVMAGGAA